ncbi:hypothetical protein QBC32DRAFT_123353 [Pseudoneurospora amorphoporcata]|uniref:Uncharacterized protein n=1 Tax=Pseudoneurospora amorphoporcata TaxID=241081 RepID=A0AAN6SHI0_9PEZI|nr:hypothetical protein QBC32DRAFT_123353 [Pseudoneurospora amorphoporcata]
MPSVAHERLPSAKKRRRDDDEDSYTSSNIQIPFSHPALDTTRGLLADKSSYTNPTILQPYPSTLRKIIPIAINKKQRMSVSDDVHHREDIHHGMRAKSNSPTSASHHHHQKQQHALLSKVKCLDRCHICCRKPSKKADLDSYADCEGCGQRTCYVCMRQCPGWTSSFHHQGRNQHTGGQEGQTNDIRLASSSPENSFTMLDADAEADVDLDEKKSQRSKQTTGWHANGHRETICGQCCEERGDNGDVVCFGCLPSFGG